MMIELWIISLPWIEINKVTENYRINPRIIAAIISVESSGNSCATRYENHYKYLERPKHFASLNRITEETEIIHQKTSWGLMQVMGGVARELGFKEELVKLCDPILGVSLGVRKLNELINKYDSISDAISAYNQGSPKKNSVGAYSNQAYVDKVTNRIAMLQ